MWMSIGGVLRNTIADVPGRPPSVEACLVPGDTTPAPNMSTLMTSTSAPQLRDRGFSFYDMSFLWLTSVAMLIGFVVASLVSLVSGTLK
ncbi:unnamed protein product [Dibothriocephalus latus]|uniref:Uncharacterized protein n=1 Tax=Dibothriocephalus latus TaxID=60516 RepID=A0A3P7L824_DIBLA|nr:unnamed protein product [Dibothriocephalus latus]